MDCRVELTDNQWVYWRPSSILNDIPPFAVQFNGETFVGRAYLNGSLELAEIIRLDSEDSKTFATCHGQFVRYYEILCANNTDWISKWQAFPRNGFRDQPLFEFSDNVFIGRAFFQGVPMFGLVKDETLMVHMEGEIKMFKRYQVLAAVENCSCLRCGQNFKCGACIPRFKDWQNWVDYNTGAKIEWRSVSTTEGTIGVPKNAVYARTHCKNTQIFVGRAKYQNNTYPAAVCAGEGGAYICVGKSRIFVQQFELLISGCVGWVDCPVTYNHIPMGAIVSHYTDGQPQFIFQKNYSQCSSAVQVSNAVLVNLDKYKQYNLECYTKPSVAVKGKRAEEDEVLTCKICFKNKVDTILIPCYHVILCSNCCARVLEEHPRVCPICRKHINASHNIFY